MSRWIAAWACLFAMGVVDRSSVQSQLTAAELAVLADRPKETYREAVLHVRATVLQARKGEQAAEFDVYRKGNDRALVVFTAGNQIGRRMLTVGDKFWLIVPGSSKAIPVTANQRLVGGAAMADVSRLSFAEDFTGVLRPREETIGDLACDVIDLKSMRAGSPYGSGTLWLDRQEHLARKVVFALVSGKPARELSFARYGVENGGPVVLEMSIRDLASGARGLTTKLEYSRYRKMSLPDSIFTPEGARTFAAEAGRGTRDSGGGF